MLARAGAFVHVHQQPEEEGQAHAHAARLVHVPEHQHHRQQVGQRRVAARGQQVETQRHQQREADEQGLAGSSSWSDHAA
jgi:hypothetical protein